MSNLTIDKNDLPSSWLRTQLGRVVNYGRTTKVEPSDIPGDAWVLELEDIEKDSSRILQRMTFSQRQSKSTKNKFLAGDVLYGKLRPYLNKVVIADQPGYCTTEIVPISAGLLDNRFLFYWLKHPTFLKYVEAESHGLNMPRLGTDTGSAAPFVLAPREEQTRIADQLDALSARINACRHSLDAIPALLKRFRQAVLTAAASGELLDKPSVAPFPRVALRAVLAEPLRNGKSVRDGDGMPVLRLTSLKAGGIDLSETKTGDWAGIKDVDRFLIQNGDYLVSRGNGSKELVGRGGLVSGCESSIAFPDTMIRMRPDPVRLSPAYLGIVWSSPLVRRQIELAAKTTAGIWKVSQPDLENVHFPLPTAKEQAEIVRRVEMLFKFADRIEARYTASCRQAQRLTPLVLAKAFRGELVQQNPQEEPASILLQRIAGKQPEKQRAARGRPRTKKPETVEVLPVAPPDWTALPPGAWAAQVPADEHTATAQLTAVLRAWGKPMPRDAARLATLLCLQPRLLTAALPAEHAGQWCRLVGDAAAPLPSQVVTLQPTLNTPWRNATSKMRARGDLIESGSDAQGTWALGPDATRVDTAGWPEGRAGWVVHYLQTHGVEAVLPALATEVQEFVHARAA
jgi:type I restriction enzyme S subunit